MEAQVGSERRRYRRIDLPDVSVTIRPVLEQEALGEPIMCQLRNVSLAGLQCVVPSPAPLSVSDRVVCVVNVPRERTRLFPFTRLHGRGWVARIEPVHTGRRMGEAPDGAHLLGIAVTFAPDATALATFE
jgi:hypothetical protein